MTTHPPRDSDEEREGCRKGKRRYIQMKEKYKQL